MDGFRTELAERPGRPRVLLAITAPLMGAGAADCLSAYGFAAGNGYADATALVESALRELPDAVVIDKDLPGGGIRAATEVSSAVPEVAVVILAEKPTEADVLDAIHAGALGCLPKDISIEGLARAVRGVLAGEPALPRKLVAAVFAEIRRDKVSLLLGRPHKALPDLTLRELEVLRLLARDASTVDVARALSISPITVRRHCAAICRKLNVRDRATAVERVRRSRWPPDSHLDEDPR